MVLSLVAFRAGRRGSRFAFSRLALPLIFFIMLAPPVRAQNFSGDSFSLNVRVREAQRETPLEAVHVQLEHFPDRVAGQEFTDSRGMVVFRGLGVGSYIIRATKDGYQPGEGRADFRRGDGVQSTEIALTPLEKDSPSGPGGTISKQLLAIPEDARKEFERALHLFNDAKKPSESVMALNHAIEIFPAYPDAYVLLGVVQLQLKDFAASEKALRRAIDLAPRSTAAYYPLATLLYGQKRLDEEEALLHDAEKLDATDWKWPFELARCSAGRADWTSALRYGKEAAAMPGASPKVHLLLADIYSNSARPKDAITELEEFSRLDPQSPFMARVRQVLPALRQRAAAEAAPEIRQP
jgi:tetratricopeptide (TPR) repeat protein